MAKPLPLLGAPEVRDPADGHVFFQKGFRPFFFLGSFGAAALLVAWLLSLFGHYTPTALPPALWHAHEMLFGFAVAIIAGFLLTAVENWTGRPTARGLALAGLAAIWTLGRIAMAVPGLPRALVALVDGAFLPLLGVAIAIPIVATKNRRNFLMIGVVAALATLNGIVHAATIFRGESEAPRLALLATVDVIVVLLVAISSRVVPMFTRNASSDDSVKSRAILDKGALFAVVAVAFTSLAPLGHLALPTAVTSLLAGTAGLFVALRSVPWLPRKAAIYSAKEPLLWVLHVGCFWIAAGLLGGALAPYAGFPSSLPLHAKTVGALGSLTLGMMARVALGHTGRALVAPRAVQLAFAALFVSAIVRVVVPQLLPGNFLAVLVLAGSLWALAWVAYGVTYAKILFTPRVDGKAG